MASEKFEKYLGLIQRQPKTDKVNVEAMRRNQDAVGGSFPDGVTSTVVDAGGVPGEMIVDEGAATDAVVLYLHGGGYVAGSIDSHRNLTGHLARAMGCQLLALDYRLAPEHPHPAPVEDALAAYRWLLGEGYPESKIAVAGDSAGGGLTVALLLAAKQHGLGQPAAAIPISPWLDMEAAGESMSTRADADPMISRGSILNIAALFLGDADARDPLASPLHGDLTGLPPILIQVGDAEVLLDDSTRFETAAAAAGVDVTLEVWPEMIHVWHGSAGFVPESDEAIARIAEFARPRLGLG